MEELEAKFRIHEEQSNTSNPSSSVTKSTENTTLLAKSGINDTNQYESPGRTQPRGPRRQKRSRQRSIQTIGGPSGCKGTSNDLQACLSEPTSGLMVSRRGASISDNQNCTPDDHRPGVYTPIDATTQSLGGRERSSPPVPTSDLPHGHAEKVIPNQVHYENALGISNPVDLADLQCEYSSPGAGCLNAQFWPVDAVGSPCPDSSLDVFGAFWSNDFDCAGVIGTPTTMKVPWEAGSIPRMRTENRPIHRNDSFEYQQQTTYPASTETSNSTGQIPFPPPGHDASMQERISYVMDCARHVGFEDFDSVAETYYDSHFSDTSGLNGVQKISRNRHLPRILAALRRAAQTWTAWERRGFNQEMVIGAEKILLEEYDSSNTLKQFSDWTTGASPDLNNHISIMTRCLQDEVSIPLWSISHVRFSDGC